MLHKFSLMNSPFKTLTEQGEGRLGCQLFMESDQNVTKQKAKLKKFISENFLLSRIQETSILIFTRGTPLLWLSLND